MGDPEEKYGYDMYAGWQIQQLNEKYGRLRQEDFESPEAYRSALIDQYAKLREEEYRAVCYNVGLEMYRDSMAIIQYTGDKSAMNRYMWRNDDIPETVVTRDSVARYVPGNLMTNTAADWWRNRQVTVTNKNGQERTYFGSASCAITGSAIVSSVADQMGYSGENGPITLEGHYCQGANGFMTDPKMKGYSGRGQMEQLLREGKIGVGDRFSVESSGNNQQTNPGGSGYHERTIIGVDRDDVGNVVGYTVQGNNSAELSYHRVPDSRDTLNSSQVIYASTNAWMKDQIRQECLELETLAPEQIQGKIGEVKERTASVIRDTATDKERDLIENNTNPRFSEHYAQVQADYQAARRAQNERMLKIVSDDLVRLTAKVESVQTEGLRPPEIKLAGVEELTPQVENTPVEETIPAETPTVSPEEAILEEITTGTKEMSDAEKLMVLRGVTKGNTSAGQRTSSARPVYASTNAQAMIARRGGRV